LDVVNIATSAWRKEYIDQERSKVHKRAAKEGRQPKPSEFRADRQKIGEKRERQRDQRIRKALIEAGYSPTKPSASKCKTQLEESLSQPSSKKRRLSADQKIALGLSSPVNME
jgi:hypothetical protein